MRALLPGMLIVLAQNSWACGYCVEDKIAATYDHSVVTQALSQGHHVVFFHVDGPVTTRTTLERVVYSVPAVDKGSARISPDALTVSFSFDPARANLADINARLDRTLARRRLSLMPMRVMEQPADLKTVRR